MPKYDSIYIYGNHRPHPGAAAFREVMDMVQSDLPEDQIETWEMPDSVEMGRYCTITGYAPGPGCPTASGYYKVGVPRGQCTGGHAAAEPAA